ncbi:hypothetical protein F5B20DRAFT_588467 [Whalleya microplaca]|nr:hypothetical protein F5B20DRAFT_588467 [Whalleya microplaca]
MSSNSDPVAVSSAAGTWVAAFFALVAVVGIVAPWLALQAAFSDRNRALNAIRDVPQKYVTRGLRVSRHLSPTYISNDPSLPMLICPPAASNTWTLSSTNYYNWNTGWAKLCELIRAYDVHDATDGSGIPLDIPQDGSLEIVDGLTALGVSKYWILLVGLLGRYGKRKDRGILYKSSIRRDMGGERASIRHWVMDDEASEGSDDGGSPSWRTRSTNSSPGRRMPKYNVYRMQHGNWRFTNASLPSLHGITGGIRVLGRLKGSWRDFASVSFNPHSMSEIMGPGVVSKRDISPLRTLFWLAYGFMPHMHESDVIISLEDPPNTANRGRLRVSKQRRYFRLLEANYMPSSIGKAMRQLSMGIVKVMQFLEVPPDSYTTSSTGDKPSEKQRDLNRRSRSSSSSSESTSSYKSMQISVDGDWVVFTSYSTFRGATICLFKDDVEKLVTAFLCLNWDPWGYLVWRRNCSAWKGLLHRAMNFLKNAEENFTPETFKSFDRESNFENIDWSAQSELDASETEKIVRFETKLSDWLGRPATRALRIPLATLFILDSSFQDFVKDIFWVRKNPPSSAAPRDSNGDGPSKETAKPQDETPEFKKDPKIEFDLNTKELRSRCEGQDYQTWKVDANMVNPLGSNGVVDISPQDILLIGLWAAVRAFLWVHSLDSRPLVDLVNDLDRHVYVI